MYGIGVKFYFGQRGGGVFRSLDDRITSYCSYPITFKLRDLVFQSLGHIWFDKIDPPEGLLQLFV